MKIAIVGYGNLGKIVEKNAVKNKDIDIVGIFSRRNLNITVSPHGNYIYPFSDIIYYKDEIDIAINCMGSANDLAVITPYLAQYFNVADCFEGTDEQISSHLKKVDKYAVEGHNTAIINCGLNTALKSTFILNGNSALHDSSFFNYKRAGVDFFFTNAAKSIDGIKDAVIFKTERFVYSIKGKKNNFVKLKCYVSVYEAIDKKAVFDEILSLSKKFAIKDVELIFIKNFDEINKSMCLDEKIDIYYSGNGNSKFFLNFSEHNCNSVLELSAGIIIKSSFYAFQMSKNEQFGCKSFLEIPFLI